jgi:glycosyltransferase involved in cell wall biosynthesis
MTVHDVDRIGVVVPACNEEQLLPGCLESLAEAARVVEVPTRILVVLDSCTDGSSQVCERFGVETLGIHDGNVGRARARGCRAVIGSGTGLERLWLASTDADTRVDPTWLRDQVELARTGVDVVLGVVRVAADGLPPALAEAHRADYANVRGADGRHGHVHGANLGVRACAYVRSGGFPPVANHEDRRLVEALSELEGVVIERCRWLAVTTSGRLDGRCHEGFAQSLAALAARVAS